MEFSTPSNATWMKSRLNLRQLAVKKLKNEGPIRRRSVLVEGLPYPRWATLTAPRRRKRNVQTRRDWRMQILKKSILVLTLLMLFAGCKMGGIRGSGNRKTEKKELPAFKAVETGGAFDVEITCQKPQSVEIEADDNLLPLLETDVADGVLHVGMKQNYNSRKLIVLRIAVPDLNRITISGAGTARVTG